MHPSLMIAFVFLPWATTALSCKASYEKDINAHNNTDLVCYTYSFGTSGRGVVQNYCNYADMGTTVCDTGKCYRKEKVRMGKN